MRAAEAHGSVLAVDDRLEGQIHGLRAPVRPLPAAEIEELALMHLWNLREREETLRLRTLKGRLLLRERVNERAAGGVVHDYPCMLTISPDWMYVTPPSPNQFVVPVA